LHTYIFTEETIEYNVKIGNKDEAIQVLAKIYPNSEPSIHEEMFEEKRSNYLN